MKLLELRYRDDEAEWGFDNIVFSSDVTLLVGASGVGKTRILRAIQQLRQISNGTNNAPLWGVTWAAKFVGDNQVEYFWTGSFDRRDTSLYPEEDDEDDPFIEESDQIDRKSPRILQEELLADHKPVFSRREGQLALRGKKLEAKLSAHESGLKLLSEEELIKEAKGSLTRIVIADPMEDLGYSHRYFHSMGFLKKATRRYTDLASIREANLSTWLKIALVHSHERSVFDEIVEQFKQVFPYVKEVVVEDTESPVFGSVPMIKLRESGSSKYFSQDALSAGMRRTLMHLARMSLWADGTLFLIDEFENSLGANCIDVVANGLVSGRQLQFIVTSHHPYIINNVPHSRWKVIARSGGDIRFFTAADLGIGKSRQSAFNQLVNSEVFMYGTLPNESLLAGRGEEDRSQGVSRVVEPPAS